MKQALNILYWIIIAAAILFFAYSKGWIFAGFESISPTEANALIHNQPEITLLDVRTPEEYAQEHIDGALLIPLQTLENNLAKLEHARGKPIVVYCHSGNRSVAASRILFKNGFTPLNMQGGITGWTSEGFTVVH